MILYLLFFALGIGFGLFMLEYWRSKKDPGTPNPALALCLMVVIGFFAIWLSWDTSRGELRNEQKVREYLQNESYAAGYEDGYSDFEEEHRDELIDEGYESGYEYGYMVGYDDGLYDAVR